MYSLYLVASLLASSSGFPALFGGHMIRNDTFPLHGHLKQAGKPRDEVVATSIALFLGVQTDTAMIATVHDV